MPDATPTIIIRNYKPEDEAAIEDITYRTSFKGEDLTGRGFFDDSRLWFEMFIYYYTKYEPQHFFVAVANDTVVGFICGTTDTVAQQRAFRRKMIWRIVRRVLLHTIWRYPTAFRTLTRMRGPVDNAKEAVPDLKTTYLAHLHINLLPEYQHLGIGTRLMRHFEAHLIDQGAKGVHLQTTNHNRKAVSFYEKMGFALIHETELRTHPELDDLKLLTFAKKLQPKQSDNQSF